MKALKKWVRSYFGFSQRETYGTLVLWGLILVLLVVPTLYDLLLPTLPSDQKEDKRIADSLIATLKINSPKNSDTLFYFDPNHISIEDWQKLGLPGFLAKRIEKYKAKGGQFRKKEDLMKIYDFPRDLYNRLEAYIIMESPTTYRNLAIKKRKSPQKNKNLCIPFDLNAADTSQLKKIQGIGSKLSKRIVAFREKLGGFYAISQLDEVYGLSFEITEKLKNCVFITRAPVKIKINHASFEELRRHPYLGYNGAKVILNYKKQNGSIKDTLTVKNILNLNGNKTKNVLPYLSFE